MRILILGAGAIGGLFGARLVEAGTDVTFLVRPARHRQLSVDGIRLINPSGDFNAPVRAVETVDDHYDLVIITCKAWDLDAAIDAIAPAVGARTCILPLLNGLAHFDGLDRRFGAARVLGGFAHCSATLRADGAIEQFGDVARLVHGGRHGNGEPRDVVAALGTMRAQVIDSPQIELLMWQKFVLIASLAGTTCLFRGSIGEINATTDGRTLVRRLYGECLAVAAGSGFALGESMTAEALGFLQADDSPLKASMLRDIERGAPVEVEQILGDMLARAARFGIDTPILAAATTHVRVYAAART